MTKNSNPNAPIGFIDSGVGGLSVVKAAREKLPTEQFIYVGDEARMPYGPRPAEEVVTYTMQMARFLVANEGIKLLVVACNTATARALPLLQAELPIPVVGVIAPGVKGALAATKNQHVGVIATQGTVDAQSYQTLLQAGQAKIDIDALPTPAFVTLAETGDLTSPTAQALVDEQLQYLRHSGVDTLILGCTHFPLLAPLIQHTMGQHVTLVDSGREAVKEVIQVLTESDLLATQSVTKPDIYYTTAALNRFKTIAEKWLNQTDLDVRLLTIREDRLEKV
jgi:glutamate racemase